MLNFVAFKMLILECLKYSVASLLRTPLGPHYLSLIHVQCSLFIKDTIGPTLPVLNTEVSSFQRYFCVGLYQLGRYKMSSL